MPERDHISIIIDQWGWDRIPFYMQAGLRRYIERGIEPGSFLSAVLSNDLREACARADDENRHRLFDYCSFLYCDAPRGCWGSPDNFKEWTKHGGLRGLEKRETATAGEADDHDDN